MIKLENIVTVSIDQLKFVIESARNPSNSWKESDSDFSLCHGDNPREIDRCLGEKNKDATAKSSDILILMNRESFLNALSIARVLQLL